MEYLFKISQTENEGYDTYDSAVVCASNGEHARHIHPCFGLLFTAETAKRWIDHDWCSHPSLVTVEYLGVAAGNFQVGTVICASFRAG